MLYYHKMLYVDYLILIAGRVQICAMDITDFNKVYIYIYLTLMSWVKIIFIASYWMVVIWSEMVYRPWSYKKFRTRFTLVLESTPWKTNECPLKINGWKMCIFLLK